MSISEEIEFPTKTLDDSDVIQFYHNEVEKLKEQKLKILDNPKVKKLM